jgi:hypothetical protein
MTRTQDAVERDAHRLDQHGHVVGDGVRHAVELRNVRDDLVAPRPGQAGGEAHEDPRAQAALRLALAEGGHSAAAGCAWSKSAHGARDGRVHHHPVAGVPCSGRTAASLDHVPHDLVPHHRRE